MGIWKLGDWSFLWISRRTLTAFGGIFGRTSGRRSNALNGRVLQLRLETHWRIFRVFGLRDKPPKLRGSFMDRGMNFPEMINSMNQFMNTLLKEELLHSL
jgi:hypothetical protein